MRAAVIAFITNDNTVRDCQVVDGRDASGCAADAVIADEVSADSAVDQCRISASLNTGRRGAGHVAVDRGVGHCDAAGGINAGTIGGPVSGNRAVIQGDIAITVDGTATGRGSVDLVAAQGHLIQEYIGITANRATVCGADGCDTPRQGHAGKGNVSPCAGNVEDPGVVIQEIPGEPVIREHIGDGRATMGDVIAICVTADDEITTAKNFQRLCDGQFALGQADDGTVLELKGNPVRCALGKVGL